MKKRTRLITILLGLSLLSTTSVWSQTIRAIPEQPWNGGGTRFYQDGQYLGRAVPQQPWTGGGMGLYRSGGQSLGRIVPEQPWNGGGSTFYGSGNRQYPGGFYGYGGTFSGR